MASPLPPASTTALMTILGLGLSGGALAVAAAVGYRWYAGGRIPTGIGVLLGFTAVAIYLNTTAALGQVIAGRAGLLDLNAALLNSVTFAFAAVTSIGGVRFGDRLARSVSALRGRREFDQDVSRIVTAVGRVITVQIPAEIDDIEGYDPVDPTLKETIAGKTLLFPRRLTVAELRDRLVTRLKDDYGVGHVSLDLADDGTIDYLGLGQRAAGIGPTLPPGTAATAVRGDPPFAASSGDAVQLWTAGEDPTRVATAELRSTAGDVVTLALDVPDARALDPTARYRILTLPVDPRADREFASLLRAADETFGVTVVTVDSPLVGTPIGSIEPTVVAIRSDGGPVEAIPPRSRVIQPGDTIYAVARPEGLRRLESEATTPQAEPSL